MVVEVKKIADARKAEREQMGQNYEARQAKALEDLSDTMEAMRAEFVGLIAFLGRAMQK